MLAITEINKHSNCKEKDNRFKILLDIGLYVSIVIQNTLKIQNHNRVKQELDSGATFTLEFDLQELLERQVLWMIFGGSNSVIYMKATELVIC